MSLFQYSPFRDATISVDLTGTELHCLFVALDDAEHFRKQHARSCRQLEAERDETDGSKPGSWIAAAERSEEMARIVRALRDRLFGQVPCRHPLPAEVEAARR